MSATDSALDTVTPLQPRDTAYTIKLILECIELYDDSITSHPDGPFDLTRLSQLCQSLPCQHTDVYVLSFTMNQIIEATKLSLGRLHARASNKREAEPGYHHTMGVSHRHTESFDIEEQIYKALKQRFISFAHTWLWQVSQKLKPRSNPAIKAVIDTQHQPALIRMGLPRMQGLLLQKIRESEELISGSR